MKTKTINVYQYSELSDKAKEKARDWYINASAGDSFTWENTKDDAKEVGLILKGTDNRGNMDGDFAVSAEDTIKRVLANHGNDCETYKTAKQYKIELAFADEEYERTGSESAKEEKQAEFLRSILEDYRIIQEKDEEYCQSEEYITETMELNEYEFDENGRRV